MLEKASNHMLPQIFFYILPILNFKSMTTMIVFALLSVRFTETENHTIHNKN